jgi:hypothetical protein
MWMFVCGSVPAGLGLLAAVEPVLAALLYRPAEGVVVAFRGDESDYPVVHYEVGGATHACTSWLPVASGYSGGPVIPEGARLRVYYPASRPAEGFVCDWSESRVPDFLYALGPGLAAVGLTTVFFRFAAGLPAGGLRRFARWAAKALAVWLACVLLGAAGGLLLLGGNRDLLAMLVGPVAGGVLGGLLALRDAWHASRPEPGARRPGGRDATPGIGASSD